MAPRAWPFARCFALWFALWLGCGAALAQSGVPADPSLDARVTRIAEKLRCLVCQNQSIAESDADLARDLKREVRKQLSEGRSEADVIDFMVTRYGDFVLYQPPLRSSTLLLWGAPALLLVLAVGAFAWTLRQRRAASPAPVDEAARARALELLRNDPRQPGPHA